MSHDAPRERQIAYEWKQTAGTLFVSTIVFLVGCVVLLVLAGNLRQQNASLKSERDAAIESVKETEAKWREICDELLDKKIELMKIVHDCPACKLRAEAEIPEYLPEPVEDGECGP